MPTGKKKQIGKTTQSVDMDLEENEIETFASNQGRPPLTVSFKTAGASMIFRGIIL